MVSSANILPKSSSMLKLKYLSRTICRIGFHFLDFQNSMHLQNHYMTQLCMVIKLKFNYLIFHLPEIGGLVDLVVGIVVVGLIDLVVGLVDLVVGIVDLVVGIRVVDVVGLVLGLVDLVVSRDGLGDGVVDIIVGSEKTYIIICHTITKHEVHKEIEICKYLLES